MMIDSWSALPLEAVTLAGKVGLGRHRLAVQPAQVDEMLLRHRALFSVEARHAWRAPAARRCLGAGRGAGRHDTAPR